VSSVWPGKVKVIMLSIVHSTPDCGAGRNVHPKRESRFLAMSRVRWLERGRCKGTIEVVDEAIYVFHSSCLMTSLLMPYLLGVRERLAGRLSASKPASSPGLPSVRQPVQVNAVLSAILTACDLRLEFIEATLNCFSQQIKGTMRNCS